MFEGTDIFEPDYPVDPEAGGDVQVTGGDLPGSSSGSSGWLDALGSLGGKALDAYKTFETLHLQKSSIDAAKEKASADQAIAREQQRQAAARLGFAGQAETTRAAKDALVARQQYDVASLTGSPVFLALLAGVALLALKR